MQITFRLLLFPHNQEANGFLITVMVEQQSLAVNRCSIKRLPPERFEEPDISKWPALSSKKVCADPNAIRGRVSRRSNFFE